MCIGEIKMQAQRLNITLPYDVARDFRKAVPARKRSKFIAEKIRQSIPKRNPKKELIESLKANKEFYKKVADEWKATEVEGWPD